MSRVSPVALPAIAVFLIAGAIACGSSTESSGGNCLNTIVGNYNLDSIQYVPGPVVTNPTATGTFTAWTNRIYAVHLVISASAVDDSGTYCLKADNSMVQSSPSAQLSGTATLNGSKLEVDVNNVGLMIHVRTWATKQ